MNHYNYFNRYRIPNIKFFHMIFRYKDLDDGDRIKSQVAYLFGQRKDNFTKVMFILPIYFENI